jgi:hypothetical protein
MTCFYGADAYGPVGYGSFYPPAPVEFLVLILLLFVAAVVVFRVSRLGR